jgi:L-amino acid N-acyltransferase YncA
MTDHIIRKMKPEERQTILKIMHRAFPLFQQAFFSLTKDVLVADHNGKLQGAVVLKTFSLPRGGQGGVVYWIFTDPEARGLGLGQALMDAGLSWLEEEAGCREIFAIVEGFNTSSSKLFATRGFSILPFKEQVRRFGLLGVARVWWASFHIPDIGHFLWGRPASKLPDKPTSQFTATLILNTLASLLALWRGAGFGLPHPTALWSYPLWTFLLLEWRTILMTLTGRRQGLKVRFRMWESGFNISLPLALAFGYFFPVPGGVYPDKDTWRYRDLLPQYGWIGLAGALPALALAWVFFLILRLADPAGWVQTFLEAGFETALTFSVFDILLPFFPFECFNGRRIWDWKKGLWVLLAAGTIALAVLIRVL